ncbi:conserved hypothetical protein [sediment metagenome]|uniref:YggT family protein n=1 Tax=sediment metagenome TaxID=749907 RepID=D9PLX0_9ZZZZ
MYIIGYFLAAIANVLNIILIGYMWAVIARAVLSWVSPDPFNPIVRFVHNITEPVLFQIRRKLPVYFGGIDFSPFIVILGLYFIREFIINSLLRFSASLV